MKNKEKQRRNMTRGNTIIALAGKGKYVVRKDAKNIAGFIMLFGSLIGDITAVNWDGTPAFNTFGFFIDRMSDKELLENVKTELIPMQMNGGCPEKEDIVHMPYEDFLEEVALT